jgi:hypothetical protein
MSVKVEANKNLNLILYYKYLTSNLVAFKKTQ